MINGKTVQRAKWFVFFCVFLVSSGLNEKGINLYIEEIYTYIVKNDMENKNTLKIRL